MELLQDILDDIEQLAHAKKSILDEAGLDLESDSR